MLLISYEPLYEVIELKWGLGIGDWGLGIGDWAQSPIPNPHDSDFMVFVYQYNKIIPINDKK